jgi:hypothetical protein
LYQWGHSKGYAGAWDWSLLGGDGTDDEATCIKGMRALKGQADVAVNMGVAPPPNTCSCSDKPPAGGYTCAQQASWGKCDTTVNPWMKGFCCKSCLGCKGCT